jgi:hypothetical protein
MRKSLKGFVVEKSRAFRGRFLVPSEIHIHPFSWMLPRTVDPSGIFFYKQVIPPGIEQQIFRGRKFVSKPIGNHNTRS